MTKFLDADAIAEMEAELETEEQIEKKGSVVKRQYKQKYLDRARANGVKGKAAKRSAWDWLAETLAGECLNKKAKIDIDAFTAILEANGIEDPHGRWPNRAPGWEGRFRMTGRLCLQRIVAEAGILRLPDGEELEAPAEWIAKFSN
jgi:hypothetical protein